MMPSINTNVHKMNKLAQYGFAITVPSSSIGGKILLVLKFAKRITRHIFLYTADLAFSLFFPECRILSRMPLDVFYSRTGKFREHPLSNFLVKWDLPSISSTYSALTILSLFKGISPDTDLKYAATLLFQALHNSYDQDSGAFLDYGTKMPDFRATYYGIRSIKLLEEISGITKECLLSELSIDSEQLCSFLLLKGQSTEYLHLWEKIQPNFSILEKSLSSISYISNDLFKLGYVYSLHDLGDYILEKDGQIQGFKLFISDKHPNISANKSGMLLLPVLNNLRDSPIRPDNIDVEAIMRTAVISLHTYDKGNIYSQLFNIYNTIITIKLIEDCCNMSSDNITHVEEIMYLVDSMLDILNQSLNYKGGFLFNTEFYSAPNLYASRLFVEILHLRSKLRIINKTGLENFIYDTFDFQSGLFRNYPYRSWYYLRNIKAGRQIAAPRL
ncbi:prenyltransferase/squalene oxidase repeat-containing protein [Geomesophilobacter sediminis]|uniref:Prenyltransferase alpha-alpha toroid domain-containing protein n=1 Tax=Geomesophilobacter sediminis TaxID=2798584 RepID=A0A8J7M271_9BACT|nr:hypothetical protein [Geomesophilobacter sediminis]MBJ6727350.1 hypothetical protein [Geomesophilobacter sediminis]